MRVHWRSRGGKGAARPRLLTAAPGITRTRPGEPVRVLRCDTRPARLSRHRRADREGRRGRGPASAVDELREADPAGRRHVRTLVEGARARSNATAAGRSRAAARQDRPREAAPSARSWPRSQCPSSATTTASASRTSRLIYAATSLAAILRIPAALSSMPAQAHRTASRSNWITSIRARRFESGCTPSASYPSGEHALQRQRHAAAPGCQGLSACTIAWVELSEVGTGPA